MNREILNVNEKLSWDASQRKGVSRLHRAAHLEIVSTSLADRLSAETQRRQEAEKVVDAVRNLIKVKGRHHTEEAYKRLYAAYAVYLAMEFK